MRRLSRRISADSSDSTIGGRPVRLGRRPPTAAWSTSLRISWNRLSPIDSLRQASRTGSSPVSVLRIAFSRSYGQR